MHPPKRAWLAKSLQVQPACKIGATGAWLEERRTDISRDVAPSYRDQAMLPMAMSTERHMTSTAGARLRRSTADADSYRLEQLSHPLAFLVAAVVLIGVRFSAAFALLLALALAVALTPALLLGKDAWLRGGKRDC